jgi:uncharacterized membrane protein YphA (DoxX/SURF4 family)
MQGETGADDRFVDIKLDLETAWKAAVSLMRLALGAWMIISGFSYWAPHFGLAPVFPQPLGTLPLSNQMLVTMIEVGLFDIVKTCELIGGICLILGVFTPAAIILLLPISAIVYYNAIFLNFRFERILDPTYLGVSCLYMNIILVLAHIRYYIVALSFHSSVGSLQDLGRLRHIFDKHA